MKRFLSFLAVAGLLIGATACNKDKTSKDKGDSTTPVFPEELLDEAVLSVVNPSSTFTYTPNCDWKFSIEETEYFTLGEGTTPVYSVSGLANNPAEITVSLTGVAPTTTQVCNVTLTMNNESQVVARYTRFGTSSADFELYLAEVNESAESGDQLFKKDESGAYVYGAEPVNAFEMVTVQGGYGEALYQQRFEVVSQADWVITYAPVWMYNVKKETVGKAGATELFALADDELRPFETSTDYLIFNEDTDSAAELATIAVTVVGCGDHAASNWGKEALFNASGLYYNESQGTFADYGVVLLTAGYGSEFVFVSDNSNWIYFTAEPEFAEEDFNGNDITVRGLQTVMGEYSCDYNGTDPRTAYLLGIPVNKVKEGYSAAAAVTEDGKLAEGYEQFIISTITQIAAAPNDSNALVKWAEDEDDLSGYDREDFATLETIRPAAAADERTAYFAHEWATASVAYAVTYHNLDAAAFAGLEVVEHASVEVVGVDGPLASSPLSPEWVKWSEENGVATIELNYNNEKEEWNCEKPEQFVAFFVLKDAAGKVVTWVMFTLESDEHYVAGEAKEVIAGVTTEDGKAQLFNLNEGEPGYEDDYKGVPQYKLEMTNAAKVNFDRVPKGDYKVWDAETGAEKPEWFQRQGETGFVVEHVGDAAMTFYVIFTDKYGAPVAVLYVDYLYGDVVRPAVGKFAGAKAVNGDGDDIDAKVTLTMLNEGDHGYDAEMDCEQYLLEVDGATFVKFEEFPEGIDDIWVDGGNIEYHGGLLAFYSVPSDDFDVVLKKEYYSVALFHVHYANGGGSGNDNTPAFALDESSLAAGAVVRKTTPEDEWYTPYGGDAEQWVLIVNGSDDTVSFTALPDMTDEPIVNGVALSESKYFKVLTSSETMTSVSLLGDAYDDGEREAEYNVFFYGKVEGYLEMTHRLHVRYNVGGGNKEDNDPVTPAGPVVSNKIALAEGNGENVKLRETTEADDWYDGEEPDWCTEYTLEVSGQSDMVMFSALPNLEGFMVLGGLNDKGYFEVEVQGSTYTVAVLGDQYGADSAEYTVVFYDPEYSEAYCRLHVIYKK